MRWPYHLIVVAFLSGLAELTQYLWQLSLGWWVLTLSCGLALASNAKYKKRLELWIKESNGERPSHLGPFESLGLDIHTERKSHDSALSEAYETNDAIMAAAQALPIGIVTMDKDFQITWANQTAEALLHLRLQQDRGHSLLNLLRSPAFASYANAHEWAEPAIVKITRGGQSHSIMLRLVKYLRDQYLLIARDLTQIEKLETTRKDFVANVSHELRTPLTVLTGFVETLKDAPADALTAEQREQYFNMMYQQAQRMEALVSDLLTLSNIETSPSAAFAKVDMDALIEQERQQIEALSAKRHRLEWDITPELHVYGDRAELASALLNLMTNAVRYTPADGLIKIRWAPEIDGGAKFSVIDNGIGIASEHIPRLSERFYRVDRGRSREVGGTGLGLAIAKHIALRHETALDIQSKLGQGSTFSLIFPPERLVSTDTSKASEENVSAA